MITEPARRALTGSARSGMCPGTQRLAHGEARETRAVAFTVHLVLSSLAGFEFPARGAGRAAHGPRETGGETKPRGGEGTQSESLVAQTVRGSRGFSHQIPRGWKKWRKTRGRAEEAGFREGADMTLRGCVTRPRPGLHNAAHLFTSASPTRACKRAPQHSAHTQPPLSSQ